MRSVLFLALVLTVLVVPSAFAQKARNSSNLVSTSVVLNEVYGGAGCGTAGCSTYQNDFIELKNISAGLVDISGWSVQYTSATGTAWQVTPITGGVLLRPGDTFLIAESFGANGVNPLPTPNRTGTIAMSATAAKVALVSNSVALSGACPFPNGAIIDFIGYGATANCNDGQTNNTATNAAAPSTTTSVQRNAAGTDTDVNSVDFTVLAPTPQAALSPTAAGVTVGGKVVTANGRGIGKVNVTITGTDGASRSTLSSPLGYYSFDEISAGESYTVQVTAKGYSFNQPVQLLTVNDAADDVNFIANE